ncbi:MAG: hypothetical protein ACK4GN_07890 [Runella sp.]
MMTWLEKMLTNRYSLVGLLVFLMASSLIVPQVLGEDPGFGLAVWNQMLKGGIFNTFQVPSASNIATDDVLFLTWWTPGQYMLPGVLSEFLNLSLGYSGLIITLIFSILGLWGWKKVYEYLEFDRTTVALCLFLITTSRLFTINFLNYTGGELLLFGSQPWTIWVLLRYHRRYFLLFGVLLVLSLVSFFFKSAYTIGLAALGGCAGLQWLNEWKHQKKWINPPFWTLVAVAACFVCYFLITQWGFVQLGTSPISSTSQPFKIVWESFEILTYPLTHWYSICEIFAQWRMRYELASVYYWGYYLLLILGLLSMIYVFLKTQHIKAKWIFTGFYVVYCGAFLLLYNKGADISIEYRHTKTVAYLFLPMLVSFLKTPQWSLKIAFMLLWLLNTGYGLGAFVYKKFETNRQSAVGESGFSLRDSGKEDIEMVHHLDKPDHILYFTSGSLNVEAKQARKIVGSIDLNFAQSCGFAHRQYQGKGEKLYAFLHKGYTQLTANPTLEHQFPAYTFRLIKQTSQYAIYEGQ